MGGDVSLAIWPLYSCLKDVWVSFVVSHISEVQLLILRSHFLIPDTPSRGLLHLKQTFLMFSRLYSLMWAYANRADLVNLHHPSVTSHEHACHAMSVRLLR